MWSQLLQGLDARALATLLAALLALFGGLLTAGIAAVVAVRTYKTQQHESRRQERARIYAEAVRAVEEYMESPYRIRRRDGTAAARREITQHISDVKSQISFYTGWMAIYAAGEVRAAYGKYCQAAMFEAGTQMTAAWHDKPTKRDQDVPIDTPLSRAATDVARTELLEAMRSDLTAGKRRRRR